ncbi:methionyl-tRNA formyltransferase [Natronospira proteinivora]|uniref:Methionyl-tRNA formyltransferase n=1 Tax=Natronospira proteinivora TaxID=1807133 RepID=A0ABT1GCH7_9GAMM|nr:methionyl-tRNA formyltransferase [Natronospira proteinivora]MCP1728073.1 methionyl-tRNA formyltransferase [Natronospira proteinivora]
MPDNAAGGLRIVYAGTPDFAVPALDALHDAGHQVVGVFTQPDRPAGRGRRLQPSPVKQAAQSLDIPVYQPQRLDAEAQADLKALAPDLMVVAAYGLILPRAVLILPRMGCINIHASLLPRWRGAAPIQRAIQAGDDETGITIMQMDEGLDTGPMLMRRPLPIAADETGGSLHDKLAALGGNCILDVVDGLAMGRIKAEPQPETGVCYARKLTKAEALIDWNAPAMNIERQVRAFNPWPVAQTQWGKRVLRIHSAHLHQGDRQAAPGRVIRAGKSGVVIACGEGALVLETVQLPGKRPISARDLANAGLKAGVMLGRDAETNTR